jgi:kynureninase
MEACQLPGELFLMELSDARLGSHGFAIVTPREQNRRGGHVALAHPAAARICMMLLDGEDRPSTSAAP